MTSMSDPSDNRKYSRSPIDFVLEVSAESEDGRKFKDKAVLEDVSGEGAMFQTGKGDMYFTGQLLNLAIVLPEAEKMEAHMRSKAVVVRVDSSNVPGKDNNGPGYFVAVKFKTHLHFKKVVH